MKRYGVLSILALVMAPSAGVADDVLPAFPLVHGVDRPFFQALDARMSAQEYDDLASQNRRAARRMARDVIQTGLSSVGLERAGKYTGAALGFAAQGASLNLNRSKTLSLDLDDPSSNDRQVLLKMKLEW